MFTTALSSPSRSLDHGAPEATLDQAAARGSWRSGRPDSAAEQPAAQGSWRAGRPDAAPAPSRDHAHQPARALPADGYDDATTRCYLLDPSLWGLGLDRPGRATPSTTVMYQGVTCDLSTEAGRDELENRLEADGADYDKVSNQVRAGGKTYDLDTEMGRRAFLADGKDGLVDGKWGDSAKNVVYEGKSFDTRTERGRKALEKAIEGYGVEYDRASNQVKVGGKSYDLDTRAGRTALEKDLADGVLDGKAAPAERKGPGEWIGERQGGRSIARALLEDYLCPGRGPALRA